MSSFSTSQDKNVEKCDNVIGDKMIGKALKYMRKDKNFSQEYISNKVKIGRTTLSDYEREKTDINFDTLEKIAKVCGYKIKFVESKTGKSFEVNDLTRKDI